MKAPDAAEFKKAMAAVVASHEENEHWTMIKRSTLAAGVKVLTTGSLGFPAEETNCDSASVQVKSEIEHPRRTTITGRELLGYLRPGSRMFDD